MPKMQDFVDSLCQCFGTNIPQPDSFQSGNHNNSKQQQHNLVASEVKRRSRSSTSKDKLKSDSNSASSRKVSRRRSIGAPSSDQPAQSKQVVTSKSSSQLHNQQQHQLGPKSLSYKRKRSGSSRDDIFRTKSRTDSGISSNSCSANGTVQGNPFSRFLSNHPVIMNSLCFATPINGSSDDNNAYSSRGRDGEPIDAQSVISACDDEEEDDNTMTSTVYYETTKLAGLRQTNPPMPLFNHFAVDERDDIHKIVATHSHTSARLIDLLRNSNNQQGSMKNLTAREAFRLIDNDQIMMDANKYMNDQQTRQQMNDEDDESPPPMTNCSSDSSNGSNNR